MSHACHDYYYSCDEPLYTILDGNDKYKVLEISGTGSVVDGFTITNGNWSEAGAIRCNKETTLRNNIIVNNKAKSGGAIWCHAATMVITNNVMYGNTATYSGGAITCIESNLTISNTIIWNNVEPFDL